MKLESGLSWAGTPFSVAVYLASTSAFTYLFVSFPRFEIRCVHATHLSLLLDMCFLLRVIIK
jgi:hypothetical protein